MIYTLTFSILLALSYTFPLMMTPLTLGLWVLLMSLTTASLLTLLTYQWFGLILFIIYIGGMLVMFSYFAAVAPNQKLNIITLTYLTVFTIMLLFTLIYYTPSYFPHLQMNLLTNPTPTFMYLLTPMQAPLLIALASILLLALIFVVKITNRNEGPLRPFLN